MWAVELRRDLPPEEVKGTLELEDRALLFTPSDESRQALRVPFEDLVKIRRLRGSPVLMLERTAPQGTLRTAFYFVQPPPLTALLGQQVERPSGLAAFRSPKRKARRDNVGYLGAMNREKKQTLAEWVRDVRAAVARSGASGQGPAAVGG